MLDKLRIFQLFIVILLASQGIFYLLGIAEAMKGISVETFANYRKAVDLVIADRLRILYYAALATGLVVLFLSRGNIGGKVFICSGMATLLILVDVVLALKVNIPINETFNAYPNATADWKTLQVQWLNFATLRGVCSFGALISLLITWFKS